MPVEKDPKLGLYIDALKAWLPTVRIRLVAWAEACREEPTLIWQTPAVRYTVYGLGGLLTVWMVGAFIGMFAPADAIPRARTADFHVVCTNPRCGHHFLINRKFGFDDFPVKCPRCAQITGAQAIRCNGGPRDGAWVAASTDAEGRWYGPDCQVAPTAP
jgi:hypothetical protein